MSATPFAARGIRFEDISIASFGSPLSVAAPTSIDYLNAQLVAHGFTHGAGLNLADLRGREQQDVLKCLSNMLGQRLDDMGRAEQFSAKYKTLSYDHERLLEQHRLTKEETAHAQREMETAKARADSAQKKLAVEEDAHQKSKDVHQRLKTAMAYLRTTTANDVKRKEKEMEKMTDRWAKIANDQAKLGAIGAGLACANLLPEQQSVEESNSIWESALADSEAARLRLLKENDALRDVILACANALQTLHYTTLSSVSKTELEEPKLILSDVLFAADATNSRSETAQEKLRVLFASLQEAISKSSRAHRRQSLRHREEDAVQIKALQDTIEELQTQLNEAQEALQTQGQQLLDQFTSDARFMAGQRQIADMSMELMATPNKDAIVEHIEEQRQHLQAEREKHTEATIKLGREKAALEAERLKWLEEKRAMMLRSVLDDLPPTPEAERSEPVDPPVPTKPLVNLASTVEIQPTKKSNQPMTKQAATQVAPSTQSTVISSALSSKPPLKPTQAPPNPLPLVLEQAVLGASTTPPFSEDELSPTSPTEQLSRSLHNAAPSKPNPPQAPPALPPSFRTQTTPVRPTYPYARIQHKFSPAIPSPLSKMVRVESPPSSPESKAQQEAQRPAVIAEEDEESEEAESPVKVDIIAPEEALEEDDDELEEMPANIGRRPGSLSPLSRIMNMGLSPAIAPTLAISSFPGLLGTGPLSQDLITKPKQTTLGFGNMPGGFQLGIAIQASSLPPNTTSVATSGTTRMTAKTIKTTAMISTKQKPKQEQKVKPTKVALVENRPRSSKDSETSSEGAGSSNDGRTSRTSSKTSATGGRVAMKPKLGVTKPSVKEKENEGVKRKPVASSKPAPAKKAAPAPTRPPVAKAPTAATIKKTTGAVPPTRHVASKPSKG